MKSDNTNSGFRNGMAIQQELIFHMISKLWIENFSMTFVRSSTGRFFDPSQILEFRQNDLPAEMILNAIQILLPQFNVNQMTYAQKVDALDAMENILIGKFENTDKNDVFDETSRLGMFSMWCSLSGFKLKSFDATRSDFSESISNS